MSNHGIKCGKFDISVGDDDTHNDLTAEISYEKNFVALLSQEEGFEKLYIDFYDNNGEEIFGCYLEDLLAAIETAKKRLWELRSEK